MGHNDERRQPRPRRKFSDEFKRDAVDLVLTTGRPIAEVAAQLGVYDSTLGIWVRRHQERQQAGSDLSSDERARLKQLEAENAKLRMERDLLKRTVAFWEGVTTVMRYRCVAARKAEGFNVTDACDAAEVSRSAFYAWLSKDEGPSAREWDEALLINQIRDLHAASNGTYGEPRIGLRLSSS